MDRSIACRRAALGLAACSLLLLIVSLIAAGSSTAFKIGYGLHMLPYVEQGIQDGKTEEALQTLRSVRESLEYSISGLQLTIQKLLLFVLISAGAQFAMAIYLWWSGRGVGSAPEVSEA